MKNNYEKQQSQPSQTWPVQLNKVAHKIGEKVNYSKRQLHRGLLQKLSSLAGFTMLEVLISMSILSVGLLGLASITGSVIRTNSFSDNFTTASALSQDQLETMANTAFGSLTSSSPTPSPIDENGNSGNSGSIFTRTWTVTSSGTTKSIKVKITWPDALGNTKSVSISTIRSNI